MSATIGNLEEVAEFLNAEVYQREFRPVELTEYVKIGDMLHRIVWGPAGMETVPERQLNYDVSLTILHIVFLIIVLVDYYTN